MGARTRSRTGICAQDGAVDMRYNHASVYLGPRAQLRSKRPTRATALVAVCACLVSESWGWDGNGGQSGIERKVATKKTRPKIMGQMWFEDEDETTPTGVAPRTRSDRRPRDIPNASACSTPFPSFVPSSTSTSFLAPPFLLPPPLPFSPAQRHGHSEGTRSERCQLVQHRCRCV
jgi:hypothetical protein